MTSTADQHSNPWLQAMQKAQSDWLQQLQSLGVMQSTWDLLGKSAAMGDASQRAKAFQDGLQQMQAQFTKAFSPAAAFTPSASAGGMPWQGMPGLGPNDEMQQTWARLQSMAARWAQTQAALQTQWEQVATAAVRDLGARLSPGLAAGTMPQSMRELYDLWVNTAEQSYAGIARGNAFASAQAEATNALSQLRIAQREWVEAWCKTLDLPTRSELNALHQQIRELQDQLRKPARKSRSKSPSPEQSG